MQLGKYLHAAGGNPVGLMVGAVGRTNDDDDDKVDNAMFHATCAGNEGRQVCFVL
jgi:hypothetical protein